MSHTHAGPSHSHGLNSHTHEVTSNVTIASAQSNENYLYGKDAVLSKGGSKASVFQAAVGSQVVLHSNKTSYTAYTLDVDALAQEARDLSAYQLKLAHTHTVTNNKVTSAGATGNTASAGTGNTGAASNSTTSSVGSGNTYKPKYLAVIVWKRTA